MIIRGIVRSLVVLCAVTLTVTGMNPAVAGMVGTGELIAAEQVHADRDRVLATLAREDVQRQLSAMGVDPALATERVSRMTAAELATLNQQLDELPAGAGVLGVVLVIFVVFVITDVLGATDIFPFIRPITR